MEFTTKEQIDNINEMIVQYVMNLFSLLTKILDFMEKRRRLIEQLERENQDLNPKNTKT